MSWCQRWIGSAESLRVEMFMDPISLCGRPLRTKNLAQSLRSKVDSVINLNHLGAKKIVVRPQLAPRSNISLL